MRNVRFTKLDKKPLRRSDLEGFNQSSEWMNADLFDPNTDLVNTPMKEYAQNINSFGGQDFRKDDHLSKDEFFNLRFLKF